MGWGEGGKNRIECWEGVVIKKQYIDLVKESKISILKTYLCQSKFQM